MPEVPEGYHRVRAHIRRNPRARGPRTSKWVVAAVAVVGVWLWAHTASASGSTTTPHSVPHSGSPTAVTRSVAPSASR